MKVPTIKGNKVILRPLSLKDAANFCRWLKNRELTDFLDATGQLDTVPSLAQEKRWIQKVKKDAREAAYSIDTVAGEHIGSVSLKNIDGRNKKAEFGIMIGNPKYWGQGYGTEAARLIVDDGFRKLGLNRIYLNVHAYNIRAYKSYRKLGFKKEGILRAHTYRDRFFHDSIVMGILKHEFYKNKKK